MTASMDMNAPLPAFTEFYTFPFTGDFRVKSLEPALLTAEPPREGDPGGAPCRPCVRPDDDYLWVDRNWRLATWHEPVGFPFVGVLEPRAHLDLDDLDDDMAADMGRVLALVNQAVSSLPSVGRVHMGRFGDGRAHLHWIFLGRPRGQQQTMGNFSLMWYLILPPIGQESWEAGRRAVADYLRARRS